MQIAIPVEVTPGQVAMERSLGAAIELCAKAAGLDPKQVMAELKGPGGKPMDKAQWSRWVSGQEGVIWEKLVALMDACGNDAPLHWMLLARGYDLHSLRKRETELERDLRQAREENAALRRVLQGATA